MDEKTSQMVSQNNENEQLKNQIIEALKTVLDPEILVDVWTLGLVYNIDVREKNATVTMTLTSPMCPYGPQLLGEVEHKVKNTPGIADAKIELTFDPPWEPSEEVKMQLGLA